MRHVLLSFNCYLFVAFSSNFTAYYSYPSLLLSVTSTTPFHFLPKLYSVLSLPILISFVYKYYLCSDPLSISFTNSISSHTHPTTHPPSNRPRRALRPSNRLPRLHRRRPIFLPRIYRSRTPRLRRARHRRRQRVEDKEKSIRLRRRCYVER
jgi:hypothetical protein